MQSPCGTGCPHPNCLDKNGNCSYDLTDNRLQELRKQIMWQKTPWFLRLFGKPKYRHWVDASQPYTPIFYWEYSNVRPEGFKE